jgi:hypothetical protein
MVDCVDVTKSMLEKDTPLPDLEHRIPKQTHIPCVLAIPTPQTTHSSPTYHLTG